MVEPRDWPASAMESTPSLSSRSLAAPPRIIVSRAFMRSL